MMLRNILQEEYVYVKAMQKLPKDSAKYEEIIDYLFETYSNDIMRELMKAKKGNPADRFFRENMKGKMLQVFVFLGLALIALGITAAFASYLQGIDNIYAIMIGIPVMLISTFVPLTMAVRRINNILKEYLMFAIDSFCIDTHDNEK